MPKISVAQAKSHFSELIARSAFQHDRFVITRHDKPIAALVSIDDLRIIEQYEERQGLASVAGQWQGFEEVADAITDLASLRRQGGEGRDVSF
jgi:prevent-host-death family protein